MRRILVRIFSRLLLSRFVVDRIEQPYLLNMLSEIARQTGQVNAFLRIKARLLTFDCI